MRDRLLLGDETWQGELIPIDEGGMCAAKELEKSRKALTECEEAVQHHPNKELPEALIHRANIYLRQGRREEALSEFIRFVERYPLSHYVPYARRAIEAIEGKMIPE